MVSEAQLFLIGLIAPIIVWIVKIWQERSGSSIPSGWLTAGVYVVSFGLALLFGAPALPAWAGFSDPITFVSACLQWVSDLLIIIGPIVALATLLYNALLKKVLEGLQARILLR